MRPLSEKCITFFDFLRFSLAQVVLIGHGIGIFYGYWGGFFPERVPYPQQIAVVGFFFVSGFLISRSVMANFKYKGADASRYFVDRFARIYTTLIPALIFVYLVDTLFARFFPQAELLVYVNLQTFFYNLLLIPSVPLGTMRPIWSLMFEWWIYILFGGLVFFRKRWILCLICIWFGAKYTFKVNSQGEAGHLELIWLAGAIGAFWFDRLTRFASTTRVALIAFVAAGAIYLYTKNSYHLVAGLILSAGLVALAARLNADESPVSAAKKSRYATLAGFSFTLFLTHYTVLFWIQKVLGSNTLGFMLSMFLSNVLAFLIAWCTERHHKAVSEYLLGLLRQGKLRLAKFSR
ncbi:acyltransferase [Pseudomonas sp. Irchel 3E13]|jgi:peptidoglycan/LPS O-acetylase OafA/YrhL|uniref:acyltransferase family protein n=1 Tax=Pseudomonas sp. Irchel 3E13 TaxID=2008975 RepID=UPI000BA42DA9|nr:acyltransferase family protein [Pseudomonas sp. Irchel 3E13]